MDRLAEKPRFKIKIPKLDELRYIVSLIVTSRNLEVSISRDDDTDLFTDINVSSPSI